MFNVKLIDIGGDGLVVECTSILETLVEVEILVKESVNQHLGIHCTELIHDEDLEYRVIVNGHEMGAVVIRSI